VRGGVRFSGTQDDAAIPIDFIGIAANIRRVRLLDATSALVPMPSSSPSRAARLLAAVLLFLGASSAAAQTPSRITGVVTDAVGHPLPAARVAVVADTTPWSGGSPSKGYRRARTPSGPPRSATA
jgi:hypothetical protein